MKRYSSLALETGMFLVLAMAYVAVGVAMTSQVVLPTPPAAPVLAQVEPYPGQHNHDEPPKDWMCERPPMEKLGKATKEEESHWCNCERYCDAEVQWLYNDDTCTVRCHEDHCKCPVAGNIKRCMPGGGNEP